MSRDLDSSKAQDMNLVRWFLRTGTPLLWMRKEFYPSDSVWYEVNVDEKTVFNTTKEAHCIFRLKPNEPSEPKELR